MPTGEKMGMTVLNTSLEQYGMYVAITDILDLHAIDNALLGATEELGFSAGVSMDKLIRNELIQNTNVMYCDTVNPDGTTSPVTVASNLKADNNRLTPAMVNKAVTWLKKCNAPKINGKYIAIIHPSVTFDLRESEGWQHAHVYSATTEIFNGEIGELHGVRFIESQNAPVTASTPLGGGDSHVTYTTIFLGKDAYGIIDPEGGAMEMIVKDKSEIGGPLEQYSTAGYKFENACKILYPERMLLVESCSEFSTVDVANV